MFVASVLLVNILLSCLQASSIRTHQIFLICLL